MADTDSIYARRYEWLRAHVGGGYANLGSLAPSFRLPQINPIKGANIMKGSVAQHFDDAIDARISADQPQTGVQPEFDRDDDGELLMDWSPQKGRMVSLSLRADGRLSFAILWDAEKAHGTAQMPATEDDALTVAYMKGFSDGKAALREKLA